MGVRQHPLFSRWCFLRHVCNNENNALYQYYGGRGIDYDPRWNDFATFCDDIESTIGLPKPGMHFERMNNDKGFWPKNMCWATPKENSRNRRTNHLIRYKGRTQTMVEWADELGIPFRTLGRHLNEYGWSVHKTFTHKG